MRIVQAHTLLHKYFNRVKEITRRFILTKKLNLYGQIITNFINEHGNVVNRWNFYNTDI